MLDPDRIRCRALRRFEYSGVDYQAGATLMVRASHLELLVGKGIVERAPVPPLAPAAAEPVPEPPAEEVPPPPADEPDAEDPPPKKRARRPRRRKKTTPPPEE